MEFFVFAWRDLRTSADTAGARDSLGRGRGLLKDCHGRDRGRLIAAVGLIGRSRALSHPTRVGCSNRRIMAEVGPNR
jgi:hypothetical protein